MLDEAKKCWKGYKKAGTQKLFGKTYNRCVKEGNKSFGQFMDEMYQGAAPPRKPPIIAPGMPKVPFIDTDTPTDKMNRLKRHVRKSEYLDAKSNTKKPTQVAHYEPEGEMVDESAAWTRKAGKNKEGGLNEKGRESYERENPGSDLKAPSKKVGNPRRKSFCARMSGMKKKLTSSKTANDPNSRINKSLRAWNC